MLGAIKRYAERNEIMHSPVNIIIRQGRWGELAELLFHDDKDLDWVIPENMSEDIELMQATIAEIRNSYFEIDEGDECDPRTWVPSIKARELKAQFRKETAAKLIAQEEEIARLKCEIARREARQAAREQETLKAIRGVKRKSGSELPEWVKQEKAKKIKKVEELLGLQNSTQTLEDVLDKKYKARQELVEEAEKWSLDGPK